MNNIVGITFNDSDKIEYFFTDIENLKVKTTVIIADDDIKKFGTVATEIHPIDKKNLKRELGKVIRIASKKDYYQNIENIKEQKNALKKCKQLVSKYNLDMNVIDATYTFDKDQLIFSFYAEQRVDFRDLAKDLASIYKTRIELHQIGVRDKAKKVGGIGLCGQKLCCSRFLNDFDSVSISMAKNQNLSLNPTKINGLCGRLLCCLKYENDCYKECRKKLPQPGDIYDKNNIKGKVISVDILKKIIKVETSDKGIIEINEN